MYERFTDRARKVMQLANREAERFNHENIRSEHVLAGLIKEGGGVAAHVLKTLGVDLHKTRLEFERLVQRGPDIVHIGKLPLTQQVKKIVEYSIEEARNLNHNYVGTEHILLGLLREQEGVAAQVLMNLGLKVEVVRNKVLTLVALGVEESNMVARRPQMDVVLQERKEWALRNHPVIRIYLRARQTCYDMLSSPDIKQRQWGYQHLDDIVQQLHRLYDDPPKTSKFDAFSAPNRRPLEWQDRNPVVRLDLVNQVTMHLQDGRSVLLVGRKGSGRRTVATMVAKALNSLSAHLVLPNHLGIAANHRPYRESVRALSKELVETEREIIALPELHDYVTASWRQNDFADIWKVFLSTLFENQTRFLAWTTPHGLAILRDNWPGLIDRFAIATLVDLSDELVHDVVCTQLRYKCDEFAVSLEDGFVAELTSHTALWKQGQDLAEPGRTVSFGYQVLRFDRANFSDQEESVEHAELRANYLTLREQMQDAIATNQTDTIDALLPMLTALRDKLGGRMADAALPRRLVSKKQIGAFLRSE
jgi:hypothetical protein